MGTLRCMYHWSAHNSLRCLSRSIHKRLKGSCVAQSVRSPVRPGCQQSGCSQLCKFAKLLRSCRKAAHVSDSDVERSGSCMCRPRQLLQVCKVLHVFTKQPQHEIKQPYCNAASPWVSQRPSLMLQTPLVALLARRSFCLCAALLP